MLIPCVTGLAGAGSLTTPAMLVAVAALFLAILARIRRFVNKTGVVPGKTAVFLVDGADLRPSDVLARNLLADLALTSRKSADFRQVFAASAPETCACLDRLVETGQAFEQLADLGAGRVVRVTGEPFGAVAKISISPASPLAITLRDREQEVEVLRAENRLQAEIMTGLQCMVRHDATGSGASRWFTPMHAALENSVAEDPFAGVASGDRFSLTEAETGDKHWLQLRRLQHDDGSETVIACDISPLVQAESTLKSFVATLTETFAHLATGLAVFDCEGRLTLFNPALCDLFGLDAAKMAARPRLRDFLETLREKRMIPEQRDFATWRRKITRLEEGARSGIYSEDWLLPSGRILRVTGRPHPHGAVAFLFDDISSVITLERRYRAEIELSQAAMDKMSDAIAVFDPSGALVFANTAFDTMWQIETLATVEAPDIRAMTRHWQDVCGASPVWGDLRGFVTGEENRATWSAEIGTFDGRHMTTLFAPLPDGSTLCVFSDITDEEETMARMQSLVGHLQSAQETHQAIFDIALENLREPVRRALAELNETDDSGPVATLLNAALNRTQALQSFAAASPRFEAPPPGGTAFELFHGIEAFLGFRHITLDTKGWEPPPPDLLTQLQMRRVLWNLLLVAADHAPTGGQIGLSTSLNGTGMTIIARLGIDAAQRDPIPASVSARLLERVLAQLEGSCRITLEGEGRIMVFRCILPLPDANQTPSHAPLPAPPRTGVAVKSACGGA